MGEGWNEFLSRNQGGDEKNRGRQPSDVRAERVDYEGFFTNHCEGKRNIEVSINIYETYIIFENNVNPYLKFLIDDIRFKHFMHSVDLYINNLYNHPIILLFLTVQ